jgi:PKD repeat protein
VNLTASATEEYARRSEANLVDAPGFVNTEGVDTAGTDATGTFALTDLYTEFQAGLSYVLFATKPGYSTDVADVFIESDGDEQLLTDGRDVEALTLSPEGADTALAPTASFTRSRTTVPTGENVTFDATASLDRDGSILAYQWRFDDGTTASGPVVTHSFGDDSDVGWYDVTLLVVDDTGRSATVSKPVLVENRSPLASIQVTTADPLAGLPVTLDGGASSDPDGSIVAYEWQLGTGPNATNATGQNTSVTFETNGTRTVQLTVRDDDGDLATATETVNVSSRTTLFPNGIPGGSTGQPPIDVDGDGQLEDMTGDGRFTFVDVVEFVFALGPIDRANLTAAQVAALDHDDSGGVSFVDVIDLVFELQGA